MIRMALVTLVRISDLHKTLIWQHYGF